MIERCLVFEPKITNSGWIFLRYSKFFMRNNFFFCFEVQCCSPFLSVLDNQRTIKAKGISIRTIAWYKKTYENSWFHFVSWTQKKLWFISKKLVEWDDKFSWTKPKIWLVKISNLERNHRKKIMAIRIQKCNLSGCFIQ